MSEINPITTTPDDQFVVGESDFAFFGNRAERCESGAILFCRRGTTEVTVNQFHGQVFRNSLILILPGSLVTFTNRSEDFSATFLAFSRDLFLEAAYRLEPAFFGTMRANPVSYPTARVIEGANIWFQMAVYTYRDRDNIYRTTIMRNRLQNLLLESYDKMQRSMNVQPQHMQESTSRQMELFHRFMGLVFEHSAQRRDVSFYADKLCISTRYLSTIVRTVAHCPAKELIDRSVLMEIKMLLQSTDMSVQEIAYRLHFPDQSYLGRYFKKHTGESPTEYRNHKQ